MFFFIPLINVFQTIKDFCFKKKEKNYPFLKLSGKDLGLPNIF